VKTFVATIHWLWWLAVGVLPLAWLQVGYKYKESIGCPPTGDCYVPGSEALIYFDTMLMVSVALLWPPSIWHLGLRNVVRWLNASLLWQAKGDPSRRWLAFSWAVLFAYRALRPFVGQQKAIAILQTALSRRFRKQTQGYMDARFGISQERPEEAFDRISQNYKARGELLFGSRFTYVQAVQDKHRSHTHITKCLFNDFFRAHGAPEVTSLFCALDSVWADELNQPHYKAHFERPTTLAAGDDACRFQFSRVDGEAGKR
jgi:hypothetical protein